MKRAVKWTSTNVDMSTSVDRCRPSTAVDRRLGRENWMVDVDQVYSLRMLMQRGSVEKSRTVDVDQYKKETLIKNPTSCSKGIETGM